MNKKFKKINFKRFFTKIFKKPSDWRNKKSKHPKFTWAKFRKYTLYTILGIFLFIVALFAWYSKDLPTPGKLKAINIADSSKIYDRNGTLLYDIFGKQKRTVVKFDDMPDSIKEAVISAEDKNFYRHHGIDFGGLIRGVLIKPFKTGRAEGGSTITQQFVKNALLSPERTLSRKIKEIILSVEIEAIYSKDQILEFYLNYIPFGSNNYGIEAAANTYLGKKAKNLTLAESATLAALPKAPTYYSPYGNHTDELMERRDWVLSRMRKEKYITKKEEEQAKLEVITFVPRKENIIAPHFVFYVREYLAEKYGDRIVEEGGLKVVTSLDLDKQKQAEAIIRDSSHLSRYGASNAALVAISPQNGDIISMVGSKDYFDLENDGNVNVALSDRQPGSSFKPIAYATAFKDGWAPGSTLWDLKTDFGNYTPNNYDGRFRGPVSARQALAGSLNVPAVKMLGVAGLNNTIKTAKDMGITTLTDPSRYGLSLVLGGGEVKLNELTGAYSVFANGGIKYSINPILKLKNSKGKVLEEKKDPKGKRVLKEEIAYQISSILTDNSARSATFGSNSYLNLPGVAVKTGTTDEYRDGWTIGYTPKIAVGVWAGNNDNSKMIRGAAGVNVAGPIWNKFMSKMIQSYGKEEFKRPNGLKKVTVEKLSGKRPDNDKVDTRSDWYATWQIPKEKGGTVKLDICTICDALATNACPDSKIEERTFSNVHSEKPNDSRWENPVRAWLKAHNIDNLPPTTKDTDCINKLKPSVNFSNPTNNDSVSGSELIQASTSSSYGIKRVEFFADNISIGVDTSYPYQTGYDFNQLSIGGHTLKARVTDYQNLKGESSISINVISDNDNPGNVSGVNASGTGNGDGQINLSWNNPNDYDLNKIHIYYSTNTSRPGSPQKIINVSESTSISSLGGLPYYFWIRPLDSSSNENSNESWFGPYIP